MQCKVHLEPEIADALASALGVEPVVGAPELGDEHGDLEGAVLGADVGADVFGPRRWWRAAVAVCCRVGRR